jgi:hypothetical protein
MFEKPFSICFFFLFLCNYLENHFYVRYFFFADAELSLGLCCVATFVRTGKDSTFLKYAGTPSRIT